MNPRKPLIQSNYFIFCDGVFISRYFFAHDFGPFLSNFSRIPWSTFPYIQYVKRDAYNSANVISNKNASTLLRISFRPSFPITVFFLGFAFIIVGKSKQQRTLHRCYYHDENIFPSITTTVNGQFRLWRHKKAARNGHFYHIQDIYWHSPCCLCAFDVDMSKINERTTTNGE